jgi:phosphopantetheinyl transferase
MIAVDSPGAAYEAGETAVDRNCNDRHGGRSYLPRSRAGVTAGISSFCRPHKIPLNPPLEKGERDEILPGPIGVEISRLRRDDNLPSFFLLAPGEGILNSPPPTGGGEGRGRVTPSDYPRVESTTLTAAPVSLSLQTDENGGPTPPFVKRGGKDFLGVSELLRCQGPFALEFLSHDPSLTYACIRLEYPKNNKEFRYQAKRAAMSALVPSVSAMQGEFREETPAIVPNMEIVSDSLGKPHLVIDGSEGPAVSFAYVRHTMWVAVNRNGSNIGIDAEESASFRGNYPFHRVFHEEELDRGGEKEDLAALIWSAKEAVVKSLGCGFHLVDPLHVRVEPCCKDREGFWLKARLADGARERLRVQTENSLTVRSLRYKGMWVSVASLC